ncbi:MAG: IS66 family transposase [Trebonia sp.]
MPDESGQQPLAQRLRAIIAAKDGQIAVLQAQVEAVLAREHRLALRVAELERRLSVDSSDSGTPSSKEDIGAKAERKAREKKERQESERERSKDRRKGGQPGHQGKGLRRDPDPDDPQAAEPPAECRSCHGPLDGAEPAEPRWAQVIDIEILRKVTEALLPGLACGDCGTVTYAVAPPGFHQGSVAYGPALNAAAVLLSCYGNVPSERSAQLISMLTGEDVSAGWIDKAVARMSARLRAGGFDEAMAAALAAEDVLAADETPVNVLDKTPLPGPEPGDAGEADPGEKDGEKAAAGSPHVLIVTTPDARLRLMLALASRRKGSVGGGIPAAFTGHLMTDGYTGYQHLLDRIAGIQQCCQHVIRRARAVQKLGPGGAQNWAGDIITILRDAHAAVEDARARGSTALDQQVLDDLLERYDTAAESGRIHNRLRDWGTGNHPGYALANWLRGYREQVFLFTRDFAVDWTNNVSERGAKAAKRHQAVSGYWQSLATLARWCRIRSYLDSAAAHGTTALDAVRAVIEGKPWLPPLPAVS